MHNCSRVKNKLSFRWFFRWRSREHPFLRGKLECNLVFFDLEFVFTKIPSLHSGTSLLSFSLFIFVFCSLFSYWFKQRASPPLFIHTSTSFCCGSFRANHRILRWGCWIGRCRWRRRTRWYKGQRVVRSAINCNWCSCHFRWDVVFDRWSSGKFTHDPRVRGVHPTHMEDKDEDQKNDKEVERDGEECKVESRKEIKPNTAHEAWMTWCGQPSWSNVMCDTVMSVCEDEKMWRVNVFCSHLAEHSERKDCGRFSRSITFTNKSNSLTYTVASSLVCTSPLAIITFFLGGDTARPRVSMKMKGEVKVQVKKNSLMNHEPQVVHKFDILQSIRLPFLMRCGFWPLDQWCLYQWSSQSVSNERTAGVSSRSIPLTNKSNCLTYTVASSLVCTSPLAVVGLLDVLMVSNSGELTSLLLTLCIIRSRVKNKLSFRWFFRWRSREHPFLRGKLECNLAFSLTLNSFLSSFQAFIRAHRCCHSLSSWNLYSNFIA